MEDEKAQGAARGHEPWTVDDARSTYGVREWGTGYFDVVENGDVVVYPEGGLAGTSVSLMGVVSELKGRGMEMPVLQGLGDILDALIRKVHEGFAAAIGSLEYGCTPLIAGHKVTRRWEGGRGNAIQSEAVCCPELDDRPRWITTSARSGRGTASCDRRGRVCGRRRDRGTAWVRTDSQMPPQRRFYSHQQLVQFPGFSAP